MSKQILVVDDSVSMRQLISMTLTDASYEVTQAEDGQHALELCQQRGFDAIFTDQNMPRMDGLTLIQTLRKAARFQRTPIVMITTESGDDMKAKGRSAGATGWIIKPFEPNKLLMVMNKILPC